jgi:hypothetical protein
MEVLLFAFRSINRPDATPFRLSQIQLRVAWCSVQNPTEQRYGIGAFSKLQARA